MVEQDVLSPLSHAHPIQGLQSINVNYSKEPQNNAGGSQDRLVLINYVHITRLQQLIKIVKNS
jgi:hypothetical protein